MSITALVVTFCVAGSPAKCVTAPFVAARGTKSDCEGAAPSIIPQLDAALKAKGLVLKSFACVSNTPEISA